uniref:GST N-terminal domain-containing protein n=1 Tax=Caenorhabditis tropicalis TaxID=1561998 RepID=A0A1I7TSD4_9PELO
MPSYKLTYFDVRGYAEPARILFHLAGVPFEDVRLTHGDGSWEKLKDSNVSPYELWLMETKSSLQFDFDGEESEFSKFCIQTFRALSKDLKDEWKAKAHAAAAAQD